MVQAHALCVIQVIIVKTVMAPMSAHIVGDQVKLKAIITVVYEVNPKNYSVKPEDEISIAEIEKETFEADEEELFALITENDHEIEVEEHNE